MQTVYYSRFNRNIFTRNTIWNNPDNLDKLVLVVLVVAGIAGLCLPWGGVA